MKLIILAAGQGTRLHPLTDVRPKCMVEVAGRPLLEWQLQAARDAGAQEIVVVRGYMAEYVNPPGVSFVENPDFASTNMVHTLWRAKEHFGDAFLVSYGDIVYEPRVLRAVMQSVHDVAVAVDLSWRGYWEARFEDVLADAESLQLLPDGRILSIGQVAEKVEDIEGQYIGLMAFRAAGVHALLELYAQAQHAACGQRPFEKLYMTDMLQRLIDNGFPVHAVPIKRGWLEVDALSDLQLANRYLQTANGGFSIQW